MKIIDHTVPSTPFGEPSTAQNNPVTPGWTPGSDIAATPCTPLDTDVVGTYNSAMDAIAGLVEPEMRRDPLTSQLKTPFKRLTKARELEIVRKDQEDCMLVCSVIAPGHGEELFASIASDESKTRPDDLMVLMIAYKNAKTRNLKRQTLSL